MGYAPDVATILAHITVRKGAEAEFEAIARDLYVASHAHDRGLLRYEYWRGSEPSTYYTLLSFRDFSSFIDHQTSEHHEKASPRLGSLLADLRLEWIDPVDGASTLPRTESQDLSLAEHELTRVYAERFAARISSWWDSTRAGPLEPSRPTSTEKEST